MATEGWSGRSTYAALGVPVDRTILGLPLYGMTWPTIGPGVGSPATGRGDTWVPRLNLRVFEDPDFEPTYEPIESVEFYSVPADGAGEGAEGEASEGEASASGSVEPGWNAVYYDSPRSLAPKLALRLRADSPVPGSGRRVRRGLPGCTDLVATFRRATAVP
jgi:hypothetical protein